MLQFANKTAHKDDIVLLGRCLSLNMELEELSQLRLELLSAPGSWARLAECAAERYMLAALEHQLSARDLIPAHGGHGSGLQVSVHDYFANVARGHKAQRAAMTAGLERVLQALNHAGIEPVLLKGAYSLWDERPLWRLLRDIDLLITPDEAPLALDTLRAIGFREIDDAAIVDYHLPAMMHPDLPGWLELHHGASSRRGEDLLPTTELRANAISSSRNGSRAGVYALPYQILHAFIHHQFHHYGDLYGTMHVKGIFEFAWALGDLTADEAEHLKERVRHDIRLLAAFELWLAAAHDLYRLEPSHGFTVQADALKRWRAVRERLRRNHMCSYARAYVEYARMIAAPSRLRSVSTQKNLPRWQTLFAGIFMPLRSAVDAPHFVPRHPNVMKAAGVKRLGEI